MKLVFTFSIFIFCILSVAGCGTKNLEDAVEDGAQKLNGPAIQNIISGSKVSATGYGQEAEIFFHENHKISATNTSKDKDTGNWKIDDDQLCMRFYQWGEKQTLCYLVYETDNEFLLFNNKGMKLYSFTMIEKGSTNFEEGITHASSKTNMSNDSTATVNRDIPVPEKINITQKTIEDVQFFVRQTAQNCPGCNLAKAQLKGQILIGANLEGANLTEADLSNTVLRRANLKGANLYKANLQEANLIGADLTGANLSEANMTDALTQGAVGLNQ